MTHVVENRLVLTYGSPWPHGVLTGYVDGTTFRVEHVIVLPGSPAGTLVRMLRAGLDEAWRRGYASVALHLPHAFPLTPALTQLARRLGFDWYTRDGFATYWVRYAEDV